MLTNNTAPFVSELQSKISEARKTVADQKNAKLLKKLEGKGLKDKPKEEEMV